MNQSSIFISCLIFSFFFLFYRSYTQDVKVSLQKLGGLTDTNVYSLKVFNNFSKPIALKVSVFFTKFFEADTLAIAIGEWSNTNGKDYYFSINGSVEDGQSSESAGYQLLILNPQTYLLTNVNLIDFSKYKDKTFWFSLVYSDALTEKDNIYLNRSTTIYSTRNFNRQFKSVNIKLN